MNIVVTGFDPKFTSILRDLLEKHMTFPASLPVYPHGLLRVAPDLFVPHQYFELDAANLAKIPSPGVSRTIQALSDTINAIIVDGCGMDNEIIEVSANEVLELFTLKGIPIYDAEGSDLREGR